MSEKKVKGKGLPARIRSKMLPAVVKGPEEKYRDEDDAAEASGAFPSDEWPPRIVVEDVEEIIEEASSKVPRKPQLKSFRFGDLSKKATKTGTARPETEESFDDIEIIPEYEQIISYLQAGHPQILFVSGKAGTGKTTLISYVRRYLSKKRIAVVAPTGVAALNVKGVTIHSFFRLPPRPVDLDTIEEVVDRRLYRNLDLLIVDEVSMVRADLVDAMEKFLRLNGPDQGALFGGVQVMFVGDLFQLSPVTRKEELAYFNGAKYESPHFFSSLFLKEHEMVPVELKKIFRQKDTHFTEILNKVRLAEDLRTVVPEINARCHAGASPVHSPMLKLTCTNAAADAENLWKLKHLPGVEVPYKGIHKGRFKMDEDKLPSPSELVLKVGAQVMFTKNDELKKWVNGTLGIVERLEAHTVGVRLLTDTPGLSVEVGRVTWENYEYKYDEEQDKIVTKVIGEYSQFPLMLAWAVTIHKGQGKTLEKVEIDLGHGAFAPGQVYVALSRCRSMDDIRLSRPIGITDVKCDPTIKRFYDAMEFDKG